MDELSLIADFYRHGPRQGPGSEADTSRALALASLPVDRPLQVADIGCGTGASTLQLATCLDAQITAVDFLQPFLDELALALAARDLATRVTPLACDMASLPFEEASLDLIWSEGAIYNLGFASGVKAWRRFLKPGAVLAVSEITWLTAERPAALDTFWTAAYPEIDLASAKLQVLEEAGYKPLGYFVLPESSWLEQYYAPLEAGFDAFLERQAHSEAAQALVEEHREEIALYRANSEYFSYGFYVAQRVD